MPIALALLLLAFCFACQETPQILPNPTGQSQETQTTNVAQPPIQDGLNTDNASAQSPRIVPPPETRAYARVEFPEDGDAQNLRRKGIVEIDEDSDTVRSVTSLDELRKHYVPEPAGQAIQRGGEADVGLRFEARRREHPGEIDILDRFQGRAKLIASIEALENGEQLGVQHLDDLKAMIEHRTAKRARVAFPKGTRAVPAALLLCLDGNDDGRCGDEPIRNLNFFLNQHLDDIDGAINPILQDDNEREGFVLWAKQVLIQPNTGALSFLQAPTSQGLFLEAPEDPFVFFRFVNDIIGSETPAPNLAQAEDVQVGEPNPTIPPNLSQVEEVELPKPQDNGNDNEDDGKTGDVGTEIVIPVTQFDEGSADELAVVEATGQQAKKKATAPKPANGETSTRREEIAAQLGQEVAVLYCSDVCSCAAKGAVSCTVPQGAVDRSSRCGTYCSCVTPRGTSTPAVQCARPEVAGYQTTPAVEAAQEASDDAGSELPAASLLASFSEYGTIRTMCSAECSCGESGLSCGNGNIEGLSELCSARCRCGTGKSEADCRQIYRPRKNGCFAEGTLIATSEQKSEPIEQLFQGATVLDGSGRQRTVSKIVKGSEPAMLYIKTAVGLSLLVTRAHPFPTSRGLLPAKDLKVGDTLRLERGRLTNITEIALRGSARVYNIALSDADVGNGSKEPDRHFLIANGIITGDLVVQERGTRTLALPEQARHIPKNSRNTTSK